MRNSSSHNYVKHTRHSIHNVHSAALQTAYSERTPMATRSKQLKKKKKKKQSNYMESNNSPANTVDKKQCKAWLRQVTHTGYPVSNNATEITTYTLPQGKKNSFISVTRLIITDHKGKHTVKRLIKRRLVFFFPCQHYCSN